MSWKNNKKLSEQLEKIFTNQRTGWIMAANSIAFAVYGTMMKSELDWILAGVCFVMAVLFWHAAENE